MALIVRGLSSHCELPGPSDNGRPISDQSRYFEGSGWGSGFQVRTPDARAALPSPANRLLPSCVPCQYRSTCSLPLWPVNSQTNTAPRMTGWLVSWAALLVFGSERLTDTVRHPSEDNESVSPFRLKNVQLVGSYGLSRPIGQ